MNDVREAFKQILADVQIDDADAERINREIDEREFRQRVKETRYRFDRLRLPSWWTAENFKADEYPGMPDVFEAARRRGELFSVLIAGPNRTGKSHSAVAIGRLLADRGVTVYRAVEPELYEMFELRNPALADCIREMKDAEALIFDDAGKAPIADGLHMTKFGMMIFSVFDRRAEKRRPTIVTTRHKRATLEETLGADLVRRMMLDERGQSRARIVEWKGGTT